MNIFDELEKENKVINDEMVDVEQEGSVIWITLLGKDGCLLFAETYQSVPNAIERLKQIGGIKNDS